MPEMYTLEEAQKILAKRECLAFGHELGVVTTGDGDTPTVFCERCGDRWAKVTTD